MKRNCNKIEKLSIIILIIHLHLHALIFIWLSIFNSFLIDKRNFKVFRLLNSTHLLLIFPLGPQPGLDALPRLDEGLPLGLFLGPVGVDPGEVGQEEGHQSAQQLRAEIEALMTLRAINTRKTTLRQLEEEHPTHSRFHSIWRQFNFISFTSTLRPLDTCHTQLLFSSPVFPFSTAAKEAIKAGCPPNTPLLYCCAVFQFYYSLNRLAFAVQWICQNLLIDGYMAHLKCKQK